MAKKRSIRLRISNQRVAALLEICDEMREEFKPANEHQLLLKEYLLELRDQLQEMLNRKQGIYTLILKGTEAIAFWQLWNMLDIRNDTYANLVVDNVLRKMSSLAA